MPESHWARAGLRDVVRGKRRDLPQAVYVAYLRAVPSPTLLLRTLLQPSDEVTATMAPYAERLRDAPFVVAMHVRTKHGEVHDSTREQHEQREAAVALGRDEHDALLEPWDVDTFVDCYVNWARSLHAAHADGDGDGDGDGAAAHLPRELDVPREQWTRHALLVTSDSPAVRRRIEQRIVGDGFLPRSRFVTLPSDAVDTHAGGPLGSAIARRAALATYAEWFLFEHANATLLTAHSSFGDAAADRAGVRPERRFYINHSACRGTHRGCQEPFMPAMCVFHVPDSHDHHDAQCDHDGTPLAHLQLLADHADRKAAAAAALSAAENESKRNQQSEL